MEIKNSGKVNIAGDGVAKTSSARPTPEKGGAGKTAASAAPSDRVTLTPAARLLVATDHADAPFDRARVDALRAAITAGTYRVAAQRIAERLISADNDR